MYDFAINESRYRNMRERLSRLRITVILVALMALVMSAAPIAHAQSAQPKQLSGHFSVADTGYESVPLVVGLADASGDFGSDPVYLVPAAQQTLGKVEGLSSNGNYTLMLPDKPAGRPFDVTGGKTPSPDLMIFSVRLMSDVAHRNIMAANEDNIASSLRISVDYQIQGGKLLAWTTNDQQFPSDLGPDQKLFTADDPRMTLPAGWTLIDLDQHPFTVIRDAEPKVDLITTGLGDVVDYSSLDCAELIPTFLDRVEKNYPFTEMKHIDWTALRARLIPASKTAKTQADCERIIRDFGNAIPDGHVNFQLPALRDEMSGAVGIRLDATSDGLVVVTLVRPGSPAADAGIQPGAIITQWDGQPIDKALNSLVLQYANSSTPRGLLHLRLSQLPFGPLGSKVSVTFQNPGQQPTTALLMRVPPQRTSGGGKEQPDVRDNKLPSGIGYIRIADFMDVPKLAEFDQTVDALIKDKVPGIIIDVRSNPGGLSQLSDAMASRFFEKGFIIGKEYTPDGRFVYLMEVYSRSPAYTGPLAILVDVNTASAADLFAYTFKVSQRAIIVGNTPSAGMAGTVSGGLYDLPGRAFIQVPTGSFIDANGKLAVEGEGVVLDVKVPVTVDSLLSPKDDVLDAAVHALEAVPAR
jgi:carboxyl-terminal processing protease